MDLLTPQSFLTFVTEEFSRLTAPAGPERLVGALAHADNTLRVLRRDFDGIRQLVDRHEMTPRQAVHDVTDLALETSSFLYAAGAPHEVWRHWSGITALGRLLDEQVLEAAQYAVIGGEWQLVLSLPPKTVTSRQTADRVLWKLVGGQPEPELPAANDDEDAAWLTLASSIPARDRARTAAALQEIAEFWIGEYDEDEWRQFRPRTAPIFNTPACAAAAIARRNGLPLDDIEEPARTFLEPGLAAPEPHPLVPDDFTWAPATSAANGHVARD